MSYHLTKVKLWTTEEDNILLSLIRIYGLKNWKKIENELKNNIEIIRTAKQCRDRWYNKLMLNESESPISKNEQDKIFQVFFQHGPQWSKIAKEIGNRTENQIKNFLNTTVRRNVRRFNKLQKFENQIRIFTIDLLRIEEIRNLLLADKKCNIEYFRRFSVSENARRAIEQMAGKKERDFAGEIKRYDGDIIAELDMLLVQRESLGFGDEKISCVGEGSPYCELDEN